MTDNTEATNEEVVEDPLVAKNRQLLAEVKKERDAKNTLQSQLNAVESAQGTEAEQLQKLQSKYDADTAALKADIAARDKQISDYTVESELNKAADAAGIRPEIRKMWLKATKADVVVEDGVAMLDGLPVDKALGTFFKSKEGQHLVKAADNSGAGATGSGAKAAAMTKDTFSLDKFMAIAKEDRVAANALADQLGMPELKVV